MAENSFQTWDVNWDPQSDTILSGMLWSWKTWSMSNWAVSRPEGSLGRATNWIALEKLLMNYCIARRWKSSETHVLPGADLWTRWRDIQPVLLLFKGKFYGKQFVVIDIIVSFWRGETAREKEKHMNAFYFSRSAPSPKSVLPTVLRCLVVGQEQIWNVPWRCIMFSKQQSSTEN